MAHEPVITPTLEKAWSSQREWIHQTIRKAGSFGITNTRLNEQRSELFGTTQGLHGRISELRDELFEQDEPEAVLSEPVGEGGGVWRYWIDAPTPEYTADHLKRRKPKMRSDRFPKVANLLRKVEREWGQGYVSANTIRQVQDALAEIDRLKLG